MRHELARKPGVPGVTGALVGHLTEEALIDHQANLQRPSVTIRELFRRSARAISNLKPCFMMSPQAIAQFLPREVCFDLVVMDEASQIKPEDALGAIARGRQLVVVGDPKQLGPTSFFDRHLDAIIEALIHGKLSREQETMEDLLTSAASAAYNAARRCGPVCG